MMLMCYVLIPTKLVQRDFKSYGLSSLQAGKGLNLCSFNPASWDRFVFEGSEARHYLASIRAYGVFIRPYIDAEKGPSMAISLLIMHTKLDGLL